MKYKCILCSTTTICLVLGHNSSPMILSYNSYAVRWSINVSDETLFGTEPVGDR